MGAVGYRLYSVKSVVGVGNAPNPSGPPKKSPEEVRKIVLNSLKDSVKLDDSQAAEVQKIYEDQHEAFDQIHNRYQAQLDKIGEAAKKERDQLRDASAAKIKALLRPDQVALYEKWQADRVAAQADRKRKQQQHEPHDHPEGHQRPPMP